MEYEAKLRGSPAAYVNLENTSSLCTICGETLDKAPSCLRLLRCSKCRLEGDRHVIACLNMVRMRARCPRKPLTKHLRLKRNG